MKLLFDSKIVDIPGKFNAIKVDTLTQKKMLEYIYFAYL